MLAPRPPAGGGAGRPNPARPAAALDGTSADSHEGLPHGTEDMQVRLNDAIGGDEIDWDVVYDLAGHAKPYTAHDVGALSGSDSLEFVRSGAAADAEGGGEAPSIDVQTLATFYDQDDARELLERLQTDIPDHYKQYWSRGVERELQSLEQSGQAYKEQLQREQHLLEEEERVAAQLRDEARRTHDTEDYASLVVVMRRLKENMSDIDTALLGAEEGLLRAQRSPAVCPQQMSQARGRLRQRLQDGITDARDAERIDQLRIESEYLIERFSVDEFAERRRVESEWSRSLLALSWDAANSKELARLVEEAAEVREGVEARFHASLDDSFSAHARQLQERVERQARISELRQQLGG